MINSTSNCLEEHFNINTFKQSVEIIPFHESAYPSQDITDKYQNVIKELETMLEHFREAASLGERKLSYKSNSLENVREFSEEELQRFLVNELCFEVFFEKIGFKNKYKLNAFIPEVTSYPSLMNIMLHREKLVRFLETEKPCRFSWEVNNEILYPEIARQPQHVVDADAVARNSLRKEPEFCNFTLKLRCGAEFPVDKLTLASRSNYFKSLFQSQVGKDLAKSSEIIDFEFNIESETFERYLDYAYTKIIDLKTDSLETILSFGQLADVTLLDDLKKACSEELRLRITKETFWMIAHYAYMVNDELLKPRLALLVKTHPKWIQNLDFLQFTIEELHSKYAIARFLESTSLQEVIHKEIKMKMDCENLASICQKS